MSSMVIVSLLWFARKRIRQRRIVAEQDCDFILNDLLLCSIYHGN